jgi:peptidoglycan/xylan/chitin deacetylase (PgdA/CDA1 family)
MRSLISLTFDDGLRCQFEKAVPILDGHGIRATFFLIANRDPTHESWWGHKDEWWKIDWREDDIANLRRMIDNGHEIGSHGLTHHTEQMQRNPVAEASKSKDLIESWLDTKITSFSYPYYSSHNYLADAVKKAGYEQARGGSRASWYEIRVEQSFDKFNVDCREVSPIDRPSEWLRRGCWHILTFHAVGGQRDGWAPISVERFDKLMAEIAKYRDDGVVEILPFKQAVFRLQSRT